jgi:hypothetical protein
MPSRIAPLNYGRDACPPTLKQLSPSRQPAAPASIHHFFTEKVMAPGIIRYDARLWFGSSLQNNPHRGDFLSIFTREAQQTAACLQAESVALYLMSLYTLQAGFRQG